MKISREWATPVTIGAFGLMGVTGLLMFFHIERGFNKLAHEWVGLVMVGAVIAHAAANWTAFSRYFLSGWFARGVIGVFVLVLAASFVSPGGPRMSPPVMAMRAVVSAPLAKVAPLAGRTTEQAIAALAKAGIVVASGDVSLEEATDKNRELQAKAITALFGKEK